MCLCVSQANVTLLGVNYSSLLPMTQQAKQLTYKMLSQCYGYISVVTGTASDQKVGYGKAWE